ncbi:MAG: glycerol-3-phosphate 1-O-acyltransferase PlsB [Xanthomonadales bacterium]|nr:Glycerol-3-phosphate acyltransferase [Xanthomonadales bacterium]MCC6592321.1 glycerol-3-phosphate 1-O-acyltransferase PlsB [Xanthomonadales bacterium]MCE7931723.1 glycerol-3-phosphate 1-O-acyltransferase PlsB [Xanthomonadales bacterium PRO6]
MTDPAPTTVQAPWFRRALLALLDWLLHPFLRIARITPDSERAPFDAAKPVCYVLDRHGLSNLAILDRACREAGWPRPIDPLPLVSLGRPPRAVFAIEKRRGWLLDRRRLRDRTERLERLLGAIRRDPEAEVQLIPVSIFVGRAPDRTSGWFKVLFSENWVVVGRFRRLLAILFNGRNTLIQFSPPVLVGKSAPDADDLKRAAHKLSLLLRVHFRRIRGAVIGPDLSHRRTLVDDLLRTDAVRAAIAAQAAKEKGGHLAAWRKASSYAREIAADYSHPVVRSLSFILQGFWNRIYDGVRMQHFDAFRQQAPGHEVIYVPSHRSHMDYLLLSYLLYRNGIVPPHIAAGVNLNLPLIGPILRRAGAFFLRRSFRANALYSTIFSEYVSQLVRQGVAIEYFIEGGRSRTGRLLPPRAGMLAMTVRGYLRERARPVMFQPVYIGYEKLIEGKSYLGELSGQPKVKESWWTLVRSLSVLRNRYGRVAVNFGESILLDDVLAAHAPDWRAQATGENDRPTWFAGAVDDLAHRILENVNATADVNPVALLALVILGTPKHAIGEEDLKAHLRVYLDLLRELPYHGRVTHTTMSPEEIVAYGEQMGWVRRLKHPLGDVLSAEGDPGVLLSYYRNNVTHVFAAVSWVACCLLNTRRLSRQGLGRLGRMVYPFIQTELFLRWSVDEFVQQIDAAADFLHRHGLVNIDAEGGWISRPADGGDAFFGLRVLAHSLLQTFQRYYVVIAILGKNGPGTLSAGELESLCHVTAQRMALLHELSGPEFGDRALFKSFIAMLRSQGVVSTDDAGKLSFGPELTQLGADARIILSRELRQGIVAITPEARAALAPRVSAEEKAEG